MDKQLERERLAYYDERAGEFDQVYEGKEPAIQRYSDQHVSDVAEIVEIVAGFGNGHLVDIACGTGFWAPYYARNCRRITFLDHSERMLSECRNRVARLGLANVARFVHGDFFDAPLEPSTYDCAMVGFLLSHLTSEQEGVVQPADSRARTGDS